MTEREAENSSRDVSPYPDSRTASNLELHAVISTSNGPAISSNAAKYNVSGRPRLSGSHHGGGKEHKFPWRVVEVLVLFAIVLSLLAISMIPTIFFFMPPLEFQPVTSLLESSSMRFSSCSSALPYEGQVCRRQLSTERVTCLSDSPHAEDTLNVTVADQDILEQYTVILVAGLTMMFFEPSSECAETFQSFLCFFGFGACGTDSTMLATRQMCVNVRDEVCVREWREISDFLGPGGLPVCEELPEGPGMIQECRDFPDPVPDSLSNETDITALNCTAGFAFDPSAGICTPLCGWSPHLQQVTSSSVEIVVTFSYPMLLLFSGVNLLLSFTVQRDSMLKIPTSLFVLVNIDTFVGGLWLIFIRIFAARAICAPQPDFFDSILQSTSVVCSIISTMSQYLFLQLSYSMLFYALFLFWSTVFPFHYREARRSGRVKSAFIAALLTCFIAPLTSLILIPYGYFSSNYLANGLCAAQNPTAFFVIITLHQSVMLWVTSSLLVVIMWTIFKELIAKNLSRKRMMTFDAAHQAELKLLIILLYFIALTVIGLAVDSFLTSLTPKLYSNALLPYFTCESVGLDAGNDCQPFLTNIQRTDIFNLSLTIVFLSAFLPVVVFLFGADFKLITKILKGTLQKFKQQNPIQIQSNS